MNNQINWKIQKETEGENNGNLGSNQGKESAEEGKKEENVRKSLGNWRENRNSTFFSTTKR